VRITSRANGGITLIEIVISFVILAIGIFSLLGVFPFLFGLGENSQNTFVASSLAQEKLDELIAGNRAIGNQKIVDSPGELGRCTRAWWAETLPEGGASSLIMQRIHVEVSWYSRNQKKSVIVTGLTATMP
jgi:hypothetical protein